ncbi:hypothetical protein SAMN05216215_101390 [Saccharopolyspora shandongensis]|uniref:Uncharacterized protein n=1 Tax=Saccharopolyspora shandongensis TaxID=418495 RepID=A0A1H3DFG2_9PSEU|nr:hypothetical protein [Saccharopolyspora shandongensis]SDX65193.1 hypothetical protein SAMN05216215_101390 [Saccharopolyspora shandongensis]
MSRARPGSWSLSRRAVSETRDLTSGSASPVIADNALDAAGDTAVTSGQAL